MRQGRPVAYSPLLKPMLADVEKAYRRRDDAEVERLLALANELAPQRTDILFNLAGRHIQSAAVESAIDCYRRVLAVSPADVDALTYLAHWTRYLRRAREAESVFAKLAEARAARAADLRRIWDALDGDAGVGVSDVISSDAAGFGGDGEKAAIVILGYKLDHDGSMREVLMSRLRKGLEAALRFPRARLIVTGGVPCAGRVEAAEMRAWLAANGVDAGRVDEEGYARDVVENCLYARQILDMRRAEAVLVITSAVDVRRARLAMATAAWTNGSRWTVQAVASEFGGDAFSRDSGPDDVKIHRDVLRAYGMPMMRTYPELVEL